MNWLRLAVFALLSGIILTSVGFAEVYAESYDELLEKIIQTKNTLVDIKNSEKNTDELSMAKMSFKLNNLGDQILEINSMNKGQYESIDKIYDSLKNEYTSVIKEYKNNVKSYEKENGLTVNQKNLLSSINSKKISFDVSEEKQNTIKIQNALISHEIKKINAEKNYQKLINEIGAKLTSEANGNKIQKIQHKIAIKELINSKSWDLTIPAIDRIITQTSNENSKMKLEQIKSDVDEILKKKDKMKNQQEIFALKHSPITKGIYLAEFEGVLDNQFIENQIFEDELLGLLQNTDQTITDDAKLLENTLLVDQNNVVLSIEGILNATIEDSLDDVNDISDHDEKKIKEVRDTQKEHAKKNEKSKSNNSEDKSNNSEDKSKGKTK